MEYIGIIIAIGAAIFTLIGVIVALFFWNRTESNADRREIVDLIIAIKEEMKDFHGRLCAIEERRK